MAEITGGELLVECLANEGLRFVFGLPCPEVDPKLAKPPRSVSESAFETCGSTPAAVGAGRESPPLVRRASRAPNAARAESVSATRTSRVAVPHLTSCVTRTNF